MTYSRVQRGGLCPAGRRSIVRFQQVATNWLLPCGTYGEIQVRDCHTNWILICSTIALCLFHIVNSRLRRRLVKVHFRCNPCCICLESSMESIRSHVDKAILVLTRQFKVGEKLPPEASPPGMESLAELLDLKRPKLREVMSVLEFLGYVERRPGRGTTLVSHCPDERLVDCARRFASGVRSFEFPRGENEPTEGKLIDPLRVARAALEAGSAFIATMVADGGEHEQLRRAAKKYRVLARSRNLVDSEELRSVDWDFHRQLIRAARSDLLVFLGEIILQVFQEQERGRTALSRSARGKIAKSHDAIVDAVCSGAERLSDGMIDATNPCRAAALAAHHVINPREFSKRWLDFRVEF